MNKKLQQLSKKNKKSKKSSKKSIKKRTSKKRKRKRSPTPSESSSDDDDSETDDDDDDDESDSDSDSSSELDIENMRVVDLRQELKKRNLNSFGKKFVLQKRLRNAIDGIDDESDEEKEKTPTPTPPPPKKKRRVTISTSPVKKTKKKKSTAGKHKVDDEVPGATSYTVVEDYDAMLNQTNISGNNNKVCYIVYTISYRYSIVSVYWVGLYISNIFSIFVLLFCTYMHYYSFIVFNYYKQMVRIILGIDGVVLVKKDKMH